MTCYNSCENYNMEGNPFIWDGSDLGAFGSDVILHETYYEHMSHVYICLYGKYKTYGILIAGNIMLCIYDEFKHVFNIPKTGTHILTIAGITRVMYNMSTSSGRPIYDKPLAKFPIHDMAHISKYVPRFLAYRELIGVSPNRDTNIYIRFKGSHAHLISMGDRFAITRQGIAKNNASPLNITTYNRWFNAKPIDAYIKEMLDATEETKQEILKKVIDELTLIIKRLDANYIWLVNIVNKRLIDYLDFA